MPCPLKRRHPSGVAATRAVCMALERGNRHEREGIAGRIARGAMVLEADLAWDEPQRRRQPLGRRQHAALLGQLGRIEFGEGRHARPHAHAHPDRADALLEHDQCIARAAVVVGGRRAHLGEQCGGADCRMAREGQLGHRRKDAHARRLRPALRLQDEHGFRQVELARNGLHLLPAKEGIRVQISGLPPKRLSVNTSTTW